LQGNRVDVVLARHVTDDAADAGDVGGGGPDAVSSARHEGDRGTAAMELADEGEPEAGRAAGDGDATAEQMGYGHETSRAGR
jgi:hypothetical protein